MSRFLSCLKISTNNNFQQYEALCVGDRNIVSHPSHTEDDDSGWPPSHLSQTFSSDILPVFLQHGVQLHLSLATSSGFKSKSCSRLDTTILLYTVNFFTRVDEATENIYSDLTWSN